MNERSLMERIAIALENLVRLGAATADGCFVSYECLGCGRMEFGHGSVTTECRICNKKEEDD